jgi:hypothetical protein
MNTYLGEVISEAALLVAMARLAALTVLCLPFGLGIRIFRSLMKLEAEMHFPHSAHTI